MVDKNGVLAWKGASPAAGIKFITLFEGLVISSCKMIILVHKISVDLILNSPSLTVHVSKSKRME